MFKTNSNILFYLRQNHTSLTVLKIRVCTVNTSIPILHDIANGVIYIVQVNIRVARLTSDAVCYTASARRYEDIEQACKRELVSDYQ